MAPKCSLRLLGLSCGSVVCAWGLLLVLSILSGASYGSNRNYELSDDELAMDDDARCPWACSCMDKELDCASKALAQVPTDLVALPLAEKM